VTLATLTARVRRLDQLSRGLARELVNVRKGDDPMLYLERKAYLSALGSALEGIAAARVVLVKACQGMNAADRRPG
jgi:hypothetical protein